MSEPDGQETKARDIAPLRLLQAIALVLIAIKLVLMAAAGPFMDESYYWMWGQHPALSYFDHPPLNAWLQGLAGALFGWNKFALRIMPVLVFAGDIGVLYLFARKLAPERWQQYFWLTLVLFVSTPIFFAMSVVALPDHTLIFCGLLSLYFFYGFFERWRPGGDASYRELYLGALFLGLATLSKYNGAFIGIGVVAVVLLTARFRPLLKRPELYLAALIAIVMQAPVLIWNIQQHFASFEFILKGRHQGLPTSISGIILFVVGMVVFLSPFLMVPFISFALDRPRRPHGHGRLPARVALIASSLVIFLVSLFTTVLFHWNLVAYIAALPFLALYLRSRWLLAGQVIYGALFLAGVAFNYTVIPFNTLIAAGDEASSWVYGWGDTASHVRAAEVAHKVGFVATPDYTTASLLGFALGDKNVTSLSPATDAFDFWFDPKEHAGEDAIVLDDDWRVLPDAVKAEFETLTEIDSVEIRRFGKILDVPRLYVGHNFKPAGGP